MRFPGEVLCYDRRTRQTSCFGADLIDVACLDSPSDSLLAESFEVGTHKRLGENGIQDPQVASG